MLTSARWLSALLALALLATLTGCGGSGSGAALSALQIYPTAFTARVGDVIQMNAVATYSNGGQANITGQVTWGTSAATSAAITTSGKLTALGTGTAQITASKGSVTSNSVAVTVVAAPALPTADYFPLKAGHLWRYTGTTVTPHAVGSKAVTITLTQSVLRQAVVDGSTWYEVQVKGSDAAEPPSYLYMRHDPEGLVRLETEGHPPVSMLDSALTTGKTWTHPEDPTRSFEIVSTTQSVTVPAGVYSNCVEVVEMDTGATPVRTVTVWFARGTGLVWEQVHSGADLVSEQKLVAFLPGYRVALLRSARRCRWTSPHSELPRQPTVPPTEAPPCPNACPATVRFSSPSRPAPHWQPRRTSSFVSTTPR